MSIRTPKTAIIAPDIFSGSHGFRITLETNRDLSLSNVLRLRIKNPQGIASDRNLDSSNILEPKKLGKIFYNVQLSDFLLPGTYQLQLFDETGGTMRLASDILKIRVKPSLDYTPPPTV